MRLVGVVSEGVASTVVVVVVAQCSFPEPPFGGTLGRPGDVLFVAAEATRAGGVEATCNLLVMAEAARAGCVEAKWLVVTAASLSGRLRRWSFFVVIVLQPAVIFHLCSERGLLLERHQRGELGLADVVCEHGFRWHRSFLFRITSSTRLTPGRPLTRRSSSSLAPPPRLCGSPLDRHEAVAIHHGQRDALALRSLDVVQSLILHSWAMPG